MPTTRPSLQTLRGLTNFTQQFRFYVEISSFPNVVTGYNVDDINYRCESLTLPSMTHPATEVNLHGHKRKQTGIGTYEGVITLTAVETVDVIVRSFIADWREAHWRTRKSAKGYSSGVSEYTSELEAEIVIALLDSLDNPIWFYKLFGCQLEGATPGGNPAGDAADPYKPEISIGYEHFIEAANLSS